MVAIVGNSLVVYVAATKQNRGALEYLNEAVVSLAITDLLSGWQWHMKTFSIGIKKIERLLIVTNAVSVKDCHPLNRVTFWVVLTAFVSSNVLGLSHKQKMTSCPKLIKSAKVSRSQSLWNVNVKVILRKFGYCLLKWSGGFFNNRVANSL